MVKKVLQLRYYGPKSDNYNVETDNSWPTLDSDPNLAQHLIDGSLFNKYIPVTHIGIQTIPGAKFYINNNNTNPIIVGALGIYELNLDDTTGLIYSFKVDPNTIMAINKIATAYLIIDIVYEEQEE